MIACRRETFCESRMTQLLGERPIEQLPRIGIRSPLNGSNQAAGSFPSMEAFYSNCRKRKAVVSWQGRRALRQWGPMRRLLPLLLITTVALRAEIPADAIRAMVYAERK